MEISNKTLVWLVVATIVVSMFGTILSVQKVKDNQRLTAYATSNATGSGTVTISTVTLLRFAVSSLNFGTGTVNSSNPAIQAGTVPNQCNLTVNHTNAAVIVRSNAVACQGFTATSVGALTIENAGNTFMNVSLNFSQNESAFFGGNNPQLRGLFFTVTSNETNSCVGPAVPTSVGWMHANTSRVTVCSNLSFTPSSNSLLVGLRLVIPPDAEGSKTLYITAIGENTLP
jgi:hypothetical protein